MGDAGDASGVTPVAESSERGVLDEADDIDSDFLGASDRDRDRGKPLSVDEL